jgi:hypothetical protein
LFLNNAILKMKHRKDKTTVRSMFTASNPTLIAQPAGEIVREPIKPSGINNNRPSL